jgi:hypothetical protein
MADGGPSVCVCQAATNADGVKNANETAVDCGGTSASQYATCVPAPGATPATDCAPPCADTATCLVGTDCVDLVCFTGLITSSSKSATGNPIDCPAATDGGAASCTCQAASCVDGVQNGLETAVDCGGTLCDSTGYQCVDGKSCARGTDCDSLVCYTVGVVPSPSTDGSPIDCPTGSTCNCQSPTSSDGIKNSNETGIDCGGTPASQIAAGCTPTPDATPSRDCAPPCADGITCQLGTDCQDLVCYTGTYTAATESDTPVDCPTAGACKCQTPTCIDGVQNGSETGTDCGGAMCDAIGDTCLPGVGCKLGTDCAGLVCYTTGQTAPKSATGNPVDCPTAAPCECAAPTPSDGVKNGNETAIDCGGTPYANLTGCTASTAALPLTDCAPPCADSISCLVDADCLSGFCSTLANKVCVAGQSCKGTGTTPAPIQDFVYCAADTDCPAGDLCNPNLSVCVAPARRQR